MSGLFDTPTDRWGLIFHGPGMYRPAHSLHEWTLIADAIRTADHAQHTGVRGDAAWCQAAVDAYMLRGANVHQLPVYGEPRWQADANLVRAWLQAPSIPPDPVPETILAAHGWQDTYVTGRTPDPADLCLLVDVAQDVGVVGAAGHRVSLLRWIHDGVPRDDLFLVLLWTPDGPARASGPVPLTELAPPGRTPLDRIVGVLNKVAAVANTLLTAGPESSDRGRGDDLEPPPLAPGVDGYPLGKRGRPFRVITGGAATLAGNAPRSTPGMPPPRRPRG